MPRLKIAVFGVGNVGKFHVREFISAGADVVAILGSSQETSVKTAENLRVEFGIQPKPYFNLDNLIKGESLDAVSVCTPPNLHYAQVKKCLEAGLHVLCEKPFVFNFYLGNYDKAKELIELSEKQSRVLSVNTQWPSILDYIKNQVDFSKLKNFSMYTQPGARGLDMLPDHLPHTNSVVVKLIPGGQAKDIKFIKHSEEDIEIYFKYMNKNLEYSVTYRFVYKADRPRKVIFSFDGLEFRREIGENYQQSLVSGKTKFNIEDPFKISIEKFVGALQGKNSPLVSKKEIIENVALQERIIEEYMK